MKTVSILVISFLFYGCSDFGDLNNKIYEVQKQTVLESPYRSAVGTVAFVEAQKDFRVSQLPKLIRNKFFSSNNSKDTVFIIEAFDDICINCPSDRMKILLRDTIYSISMEIMGYKGGVNYRIANELFEQGSKDSQYQLRNSELIETVGKIKNGQPWKDNPLQYGSDICNDGDHTIMTVLYPDKRIEAMYVRCWLPSLHRNKK